MRRKKRDRERREKQREKYTQFRLVFLLFFLVQLLFTSIVYLWTCSTVERLSVCNLTFVLRCSVLCVCVWCLEYLFFLHNVQVASASNLTDWLSLCSLLYQRVIQRDFLYFSYIQNLKLYKLFKMYKIIFKMYKIIFKMFHMF